jgi:hypothetical protein
MLHGRRYLGKSISLTGGAVEEGEAGERGQGGMHLEEMVFEGEQGRGMA